MFAGRSAEHQLRAWMERPGNWRFKALLSAALPESPYDSESIGHALVSLSQQPEVKQHHLKKRPPRAEDTPAQVNIRPLSYETQQYSTGRKSAAEYKEPQYARNLSAFSERDLQQGVDLDEYAGRMLINESFTEKDVLWREQLLDTVVMGAEEAKVARDAATVIEVNTRRGDHPIRADEIFAPEIAEGAGIPFDEIDWAQQSWDADKFGLGAYVTEELIDHALVDIIDQNIRWLGAAVENALNRRFMNVLVDNPDSNNDVEINPSNTPAEVDFIELFRARNNVVGNNFPAPDTLVMHDEFELGMFADSNNNALFANRLGDQSARAAATVPEVASLSNRLTVPDGPYDSSSNTWGYAADSEIGAVAYPQELMYLYMYRDLETKDFEDPIRDIEGANVRAQFDAGIGQPSAFARLSH